MNSLDGEMQTPLHIAAKLGNLECTKVLLEYKADLDLRDQDVCEVNSDTNECDCRD